MHFSLVVHATGNRGRIVGLRALGAYYKRVM